MSKTTMIAIGASIGAIAVASVATYAAFKKRDALDKVLKNIKKECKHRKITVA